MYTIETLAEKKGLSRVYVRRAILQGKLETTKVTINSAGHFRHEISEEQYEAWRGTLNGGNRREDGRSRLILHATAEELELIKKLFEENGIEAPISEPSYKKNK